MTERIEYWELDGGLHCASSPDLFGFTLFASSRDELDAKLPDALADWREILAAEPMTLVDGPAW